jgi:hypothetical protein
MEGPNYRAGPQTSMELDRLGVRITSSSPGLSPKQLGPLPGHYPMANGGYPRLAMSAPGCLTGRVQPQRPRPSKLVMRVRFSSPARREVPNGTAIAASSAQQRERRTRPAQRRSPVHRLGRLGRQAARGDCLLVDRAPKGETVAAQIPARTPSSYAVAIRRARTVRSLH